MFPEPPSLMALGEWCQRRLQDGCWVIFFSVFGVGHAQQHIYAFGPILHTLEGILFAWPNPATPYHLKSVPFKKVSMVHFIPLVSDSTVSSAIYCALGGYRTLRAKRSSPYYFSSDGNNRMLFTFFRKENLGTLIHLSRIP